jgi:DNA-binding CsgD family transcriptional regulator
VGVLVEALVERGELDAAEAVLHDVGCAEAVPNRFVDNWILFGRARLRRSQGRVDAAASDLVELGRRGDHGWRPWNPAIFGWRSELALVMLDAGDRRRATELATEERELAVTWGAGWAIGIATRMLGRSLDGDRGLQLLVDSVGLLDGSGARLEHARSLVALGVALRGRGKRKESREPLAEGAELADSCGASALTDQALEELRATGARPRGTARSGVDALTPSELRVARLAAAGMTNRDIAQSLFVTVRTVEVHLTHCYQKLGISSRRALGAALGD